MSDKKPGAEPPEGAKAIVKAVENAKILPDPMSVAAAEEIDANIARVHKSRADGDLINVDDFVVDDFQKKPAHEAADGAGKSPGAAASGGSDGGKKRPPRGHGGPPQDSDDGRIVIRRGASTRAREVNEAMSALASEPSEFYVCGTKIVRPELVTIADVGDDEVKTAPGLAEASIATIALALDRRTKWEVFDKRSNDWLGKNSPKDICEQILACGGEAKFPPTSGIIAGPAMRPDGSIIFALGYDSRSRVFSLASKALAIDPVPVRPSRAQAEEALEDLSWLISGFPFVSGVDRSVALSGLMTPVLRCAMDVALFTPMRHQRLALASRHSLICPAFCPWGRKFRSLRHLKIRRKRKSGSPRH